MKDILRQLFGSKKAWATIVTIIVWIGGRVGWNIDPVTLLPVIGSLAVFVLAQGSADKGKEAKKLELAAAGEPYKDERG